MNKKHQEEAIMLQNEVFEKQIAQIFLIKTHFIKTINDAEDYLRENIEVLKRYKIDAKKRKEVNNCIRRQKVYLRDIKSSSENVMDAINKLLKHGSMEDAVKAFLLSNFKRYSQGKVLYPDNYPNMGFSKEDGFSMNPLDKKVSLPLFYQGDVFSLLNMFLDLHFKLMYFWFHQADLFCVLQNKSSKKAITLNEFVSKIFARKLTRNECADAIEDELDKKNMKCYYCAILKQLSSWNVYISSNKEKGTPPIAGYDSFRHQSLEKFRQWVRDCYIPYYKNRNKK